MAEFEAAGIWVAAVANDPVGAVAQFCDEQGVTFPFLSDEGSALIRRLGILNTLIEVDDPLHGIPFPGAYLLDERGVVIRKYFHREYQVREAPAFVVADGFGLRPRLDGCPRGAAEDSGAAIEVVLGAPDLKLRQRTHLHVRAVAGEGGVLARLGDVEVSAAGLEVGRPRALGSDVLVEVGLVEREVTAVRAEVRVRCEVPGTAAPATLVAVIDLPVGDLNRARRA